MDIKELTEIIKVCRKLGVKDLEMEGLKISLSDMAVQGVNKPKRRRVASPSTTVAPAAMSDNPISADAFEGLSFEDKLFWSSTGQVVPEPGTDA